MYREIIGTNENKQFLVLNIELAAERTLPFPYAVISITGIHRTEGATLAPSDNCVDVLRLKFSDFDEAHAVSKEFHEEMDPNDYILFNEDLAEQVNVFVKKNIDKVDGFIVHCEAGLSRSVGMAAAISKFCNGTDEAFFKYFPRPNMLVYRKTLNALHGE